MISYVCHHEERSDEAIRSLKSSRFVGKSRQNVWVTAGSVKEQNVAVAF